MIKFLKEHISLKEKKVEVIVFLCLSILTMSIDVVITYLNGNFIDLIIDKDNVGVLLSYSGILILGYIKYLTIHDYVVRRQLTEAAKLLVFSTKPIIEIAFICGYESQPAFTVAFKAMYKITPAEYRERQEFYPLQLRVTLHSKNVKINFSKSDIRLAKMEDISAWMELVRLVIDGYPNLNELEYIEKLKVCIEQRNALILEKQNTVVGVMAFSYDTGSIEFMGIHPQYRNKGIQKLFLDKLIEEYIPDREISTTTYRKHDRADTGYRNELMQLGFAERELLIEFGYPTQRFVRSDHIMEVKNSD